MIQSLRVLSLLTFNTADSCNFARPSLLVGELLEWLSLTFGGEFVVENDGSFGSGRQTDGSSCGLFAMNSIRHAVLNEPLLVQGGTRAERVRWFNALCQTIYETVRRSHSRGSLTVQLNLGIGKFGRY